MRVLITGASGFVGRAVSEAVRAEGHEVRRMARGTRALGAGSDWIRGSVLSSEDLRRALSGCDAVVHLVGIIGEIGDQTFDRVHREGTLRVIEAAQHCGVGRIVHMSALGTRANSASRYHQTKWAAEEAVRRSGLAWTVFRPSVIYGPGDGFVNLFARMSRWSPVLPAIGAGRLQPVAVECVALAFARALKTTASVGRTYDLCGPERLTLPEILGIVLQATGRRRAILRIPRRWAWWQAAVMEQVFPKVLGRISPLSRDQLRMLDEDNVGDPSEAEREFGLPSVSLGQGIGRCLAR